MGQVNPKSIPNAPLSNIGLDLTNTISLVWLSLDFVGSLDVSLTICAVSEVTEGELGMVLPNTIETRADITHR